MESPELDPAPTHVYGQLTVDKSAKAIPWGQ